ncbi:MAG: hypothetical protein BWY22_01036 [Bacteroidetes bacterium ADurb.Bin217]|nr:MAG: hypothetical protein BWY22_01036 [Bacteroidetes bacterium ADurb.Bin217]
MKKLLIICFVLLHLCAFTQIDTTKKFEIKSGFGLLLDTWSYDKGSYVWTSFDYVMNPKYSISLYAAHGNITYTHFKNNAYKGAIIPSTYEIYEMNFYRRLMIKSNNQVRIGSGIYFRKYQDARPDYYFTENEIVLYISETTLYDIGPTFLLNYKHQWKNGFFMGFDARTWYVFALGIDYAMISPMIGISF